jgi:hypothetical protein
MSVRWISVYRHEDSVRRGSTLNVTVSVATSATSCVRVHSPDRRAMTVGRSHRKRSCRRASRKCIWLVRTTARRVISDGRPRSEAIKAASRSSPVIAQLRRSGRHRGAGQDVEEHAPRRDGADVLVPESRRRACLRNAELGGVVPSFAFVAGVRERAEVRRSLRTHTERVVAVVNRQVAGERAPTAYVSSGVHPLACSKGPIADRSDRREWRENGRPVERRSPHRRCRSDSASRWSSGAPAPPVHYGAKRVLSAVTVRGGADGVAPGSHAAETDRHERRSWRADGWSGIWGRR